MITRKRFIEQLWRWTIPMFSLSKTITCLRRSDIQEAVICNTGRHTLLFEEAKSSKNDPSMRNGQNELTQNAHGKDFKISGSTDSQKKLDLPMMTLIGNTSGRQE